jgi:hypothetical protein
MSIADFKKNYVDKYLMIKEKGILENFTVEDFDKKGVVRNTTATNLYENSPAFRGAR